MNGVLWSNEEIVKKLENSILKEYKHNLVNTGGLRSGNTETFDIYISPPENIP